MKLRAIWQSQIQCDQKKEVIRGHMERFGFFDALFAEVKRWIGPLEKNQNLIFKFDGPNEVIFT